MMQLEMMDLKVVTAQACLYFPLHIWILTKSPFILEVAIFITLKSIDTWERSLVIVPLGPVIVTFLDLTDTLTIDTKIMINWFHQGTYLLLGFKDTIL